LERLLRWVKREPRVAALTAAVLLLLVAAAAAAQLLFVQHSARQWEQQTRQKEAEQGIETALQEAQKLRKHLKWPEAHTLLEQASKQLGRDAPQSQREQLQQTVDDLNLEERLDRIRQRAASIVDGDFDHKGAERSYQAVFRQFGLGRVEENPKEVADRVR